ncbi:MAG: EF-hand domain-containing protein [Planctomycetota bacterium]
MMRRKCLFPALLTTLCCLCLPQIGMAQKGGKKGKVAAKIYWLFKKYDKNQDKALEANEVPAGLWKKLVKADLNKDGKVTIKELFISKKKGKKKKGKKKRSKKKKI